MLKEKEKDIGRHLLTIPILLKKKRKLKRKILFQNEEAKKNKRNLKRRFFFKKKEKKNVIFTFYIHNFTLSFFIVSRGCQVAFKYCSVVLYYCTLSLFFKICMFRIVFSQKHFDYEKSPCT